MSDIDKIGKNIISSLQYLDGKSYREEVQSGEVRLAPDIKGAMVNEAVDKYLRRELTREHMSKLKEEHGIVAKDIIKEIAKRQIKQSLGL